MIDLLYAAGQVLSVAGLAYGWYLSLTYCAPADAASTRCKDKALLHHWAMA
jgi:hypothetical protein